MPVAFRTWHLLTAGATARQRAVTARRGASIRAAAAARSRGALALLGCAIVFVLSAGCVAPPDEIGNTFTVDIEPGEFVEAEFAMATGDVIEVDYESFPVALLWNVHSHVATMSIDHETGTGSGGTIRFEAPETRLYWVMWSNLSELGATLDVRFGYGGTAAFNGWYP